MIAAPSAGLTVRAVMDGGDVVSSLSERILGRTVAEDVLDPATNQLMIARNTLIEESEAERIEKAGIEGMKIRSVLTCESQVGVCGRCYGRDLARGTPVNHRRGGGRDRGAVDRRAGHAADHAHLPYRWRGAAWRRAVHRGGAARRHRVA